MKAGDILSDMLCQQLCQTLVMCLVLQVQAPMAMHPMDGLSPYGSSNMLMSTSREQNSFYLLYAFFVCA